MQKNSRIYIAGHRGLVGSALVRVFTQAGFQQIITRTHAELDLENQDAVSAHFKETRPEVVVLAAAKVGGIWANNTFPYDFIAKNLKIQSNVIQSAIDEGVEKFVFLGSSCIYPKNCPQPMREEHLLAGPLEPTNRPYALAKIAGIELCWAANRQLGKRYFSVMPTNLYGPGDNYDLQNSHVLPALIRKMHEAKIENRDSVTIWGTGTPRREFLYSDDLARAALHLLNLPKEKLDPLINHNEPPLINVGCEKDHTILEVAEMVKSAIGFSGNLVLDTSKPDGTPRKLLSISRISELGWRPEVPLEEGLRLAYSDFVRNEVR